MSSEYFDSPTMTRKKIGGVDAVAEILNQMDPEQRKRLLAELEARDGTLTAKIREQLFTFEHIAHFDDPTMQKLLQEVPRDLLALALRSTTDLVKDAVFRNLSTRAAEALREDIASSDLRKMSDVLEAQTKITAIAKALTGV